MTTPSHVSAALNRCAESVCRHLLPNGKRKGNEWIAGDSSGGAGKSLKIVIEGDKVGVGSDFATGETFGDLLDLWCAAQGVGLGEAMNQACSFLGIPRHDDETRPHKQYTKPKRPNTVRRLNSEGRVYRYLKSRGLTDECLEDYRIAEQENQWIVFPYMREGEIINIKYLHVERPDGKKQIRQEKDSEPCLFGWDALDKKYPNVRHVCICEGEIDCCTLHQCGVPSLSVPNGGGGGRKQDWIDNDYDRLARFDTIYLCMDNDGPGKEAEREIIKRLGSERCRIVTLPHKDANECFKQGIVNFNKYLLSSKLLDPEELKAADYFTDLVLERFYPNPHSHGGMKSPWGKLNEALTFHRQELVVWSGFSESGKSMALNQVAVKGLIEGEKFCICSLEMPAKVTLWRMVRQLTGEERPNKERINEVMRWLSDKLWIVNMVGTAKVERLLDVYQYAVRRYDIRNFITDSLTKVGVSEESFEEQKKCIALLCDFGNHYEVVNHLVVHQRKPENDEIKPGKFGVRGASAITDQAHTIITIWRRPEGSDDKSKKKKDEIEIDPPDSVLQVVKNRETGQHCSVPLYFHKASLQLHEQRQQDVDYFGEKINSDF